MISLSIPNYAPRESSSSLLCSEIFSLFPFLFYPSKLELLLNKYYFDRHHMCNEEYKNTTSLVLPYEKAEFPKKWFIFLEMHWDSLNRYCC